MAGENLKLVLAGHVDHGKSTLIGRLFYDTGSLPDGKLEEIQTISRETGGELEFGFIMDHLREERTRGITIDTAQCFFSTDKRDYIIIDAPGHKEFLKNMITGASQAEAAVLICSVPEGVQEQTRRHAYILKLLGLNQAVVAYNKMDLAEYSEEAFGRVQSEMEEFLARIDIEPAFSIPISARDGDNVARSSANMPWYRGPTILDALDRLEKPARPVEKPLRFPIQDIYTFTEEQVVVGRVESGVLQPGQGLEFLPGGTSATVERLFQYQNDLPKAEAGECVGAVFDRKDLVRGQVGFRATERPPFVNSFEASIFWLSPEPLHREQELILKCATQSRPCRIRQVRARIDSSTLEHLESERRTDELEGTEVGEVTLETAEPIVVQEFQHVPELGRFILQRDGEVVAGGIVTAT